ncbi:MAG: sporulation protein YunB [Candidatus Limiplasma sp.]|nr:sporulation protein YunB [Candidatus Limiplasma sp.]
MARYGKGKAKGRSGRIFLLVLLLVLAMALMMERNLTQVMLDMAYARAYSLAVETINQSVWDVMQGGVTYDELIITQRDDQGKVTMLHANTVRMNELATKTALMAEAELGLAENQQIEIPLGAALGIRFLAGTGPRVPIQILPVGAVNTQFSTEFESAGINQTRHKISLILATTVRLVIPSGSKRVDVISTVPIAETIIVGAVPDSFVDVNNRDDLLNLLP